MTTPTLTPDEARFILTSLEFTRSRFENYPYPTYALRRERMAEVNRVMEKVRAIRDHYSTPDAA